MMILRLVEQYLAATGVSASRFGRDAARDPRLVNDLRNGRQLGRHMAAKVRAYVQSCGSQSTGQAS
jgi:2,4-dienoyl-CoA reductase-like NADH-dependent reductase (Old Yellow Enzyme family)